jgi:hypothetical protein
VLEIALYLIFVVNFDELAGKCSGKTSNAKHAPQPDAPESVIADEGDWSQPVEASDSRIRLADQSELTKSQPSL